MTTKRIYMLLGGMIGPDGIALAPIENSGMIVMQAQLKHMGCEVYVETWDNWARYIPMMGPASPDYRNVVLGYSGGGTRATYLADHANKPHIDLMILIDPSPKAQMKPVGGNVKRALVIHNSFPGLLGGGQLHATGPMQVVGVHVPHLLVPELRQVQEAVFSAVREL
jgi:pimeloyl-ACP methyl ester carboxylesterase